MVSFRCFPNKSIYTQYHQYHSSITHVALPSSRAPPIPIDWIINFPYSNRSNHQFSLLKCLEMWVSPRTRSMLGTIGARLGVSRASILGTWLVTSKTPIRCKSHEKNRHTSLDFGGTKGTKGTPFLQESNQLEPWILLVCPLGLKASRSCVALPPNNRWSHCRWCRALRARKPLRRCSQCQLQVSTWFRWRILAADHHCKAHSK